MNGFRKAGSALAALALVIAAAGCGTSADPDSWEEAEETGAVRENFLNACELANESLAGDGLNPAAVEAVCLCTFKGLKEEIDDFDEFKELDKALRNTPNPSDLDDDEGETAEANWDGKAEQIIRDCLPRSLTSASDV